MRSFAALVLGCVLFTSGAPAQQTSQDTSSVPTQALALRSLLNHRDRTVDGLWNVQVEGAKLIGYFVSGDTLNTSYIRRESADNGETWVTVGSPTTSVPVRPAYDKNIRVVNQNQVTTSLDGVHWTIAQTLDASPGTTIRAVCFADGLFAAAVVRQPSIPSSVTWSSSVSPISRLYTSPDGVLWTPCVERIRGAVIQIARVPNGVCIIEDQGGTPSANFVKASFSTVEGTPLSPGITSQPKDIIVAPGTETSLIVTSDDPTTTYQWYVGAVADTSHPVPGGTGSNLSITASEPATYWVRLTNEFGITDSAEAKVSLSASAINRRTHLEDASGKPGTVVWLGEVERGEWFHGTPGNYRSIVGEPGFITHYMAGLILSGDDQVWLRSTIASGTIDSRVARISITPSTLPPAIEGPVWVSYPTSSQSSVAGYVHVVASGERLSYSWYRGEPGDTSHPAWGIYRDSPILDTMDTGRFWVRVSNAYGSVDSESALVTYRPTNNYFSIRDGKGNTGPFNGFIGEPFSLIGPTKTDTDAGLRYYGTTLQWYEGLSGDTSSPIPGATSVTYTFPVREGPSYYWLRVKNERGEASSDTIIVTGTIRPVPIIASEPQDVTVEQGSFIAFNVDAGPSPSDAPLSYQWYRGESGSTAEPINGPQRADQIGTYSFWVRLTNRYGSTDSRTMTVTVNRKRVPPQIVSDVQNAEGLPGSNIGLNVVAWPNSAEAPLSYQWYRGISGSQASPIPGAVESSLSVTLTNDENFWVQVTNRDGSVNSRTANIHVLGGDVTLTATPTDGVVFGGKVLTVGGELGSNSTVEWFRNGTSLSGANTTTLLLPPLSYASAGLYTVRVTKSGIARVSNAVPVSVVDMSTAYYAVQGDSQLTLDFLASGPGLRFQWLDGNQQPLADNGHLSGTQSHALKILSPTVADVGVYFCRVTNGPETGLKEVHLTMQGQTVLALVSQSTNSVGAPVDATITPVGKDDQVVTGAVVTGLPPGVKFVAVNAPLEGRPSVAGTYTVKMQARSKSGLGPATLARLVVNGLGASQTGTFNGLIDRDDTLNGGLGGRITINLTANATFSGSLTQGSVVRSFKGALTRPDAGSVPSAHVTLTTVRGVETLALELGLEANGEISGRLQSSAASASLRAVRSPWVGGVQAVAYQGIHVASLLLDASLVGDATYPHGAGYFGGGIGLTGVFNAGARLADNTVSTISVTVGQDGSIPLHWLLYNATGSAHGWARSDGRAMDGDVTWFKRPQTTSTLSYKAGFPVHRLKIQGGRMRSYAKTDVPLGWPAGTSNATASISAIGTAERLAQTFTLTSSSTLMPIGSPLTLSIQRDQNKFTGTIKNAGRTGQIYGVFIDQLGIGIGHVQIPASTTRGAPMQSGVITISSNATR